MDSRGSDTTKRVGRGNSGSRIPGKCLCLWDTAGTEPLRASFSILGDHFEQVFITLGKEADGVDLTAPQSVDPSRV